MVISLALPAPARANSLDNAGRKIVIGIVPVTAAVAVVMPVVIMRESKKDKLIMGCVKSAETGMTISDEKDEKIYTLSDNAVGARPGDRMKLKGKKAKSKGDPALVWVATSVTEDMGAWQP